MPEPTHCMVITTVDSADAAHALAHGIVAARLGACAQIVGPITSVYRWQGAITTDQEWQLWIKTTVARAEALTAHLQAHHPYDTPEILTTPVLTGNPAYLAWVTAETTRTP